MASSVARFVSRRTLWTAALLPLAVGAATTAFASPVRVTNTATGQYRLYRFVEGDQRGEEVGYGLLLDRLNLGAASGGFTSNARVDGMLFFDPPAIDDGAFQDDARVERITAGYQSKLGESDLKLTVGDFYRQLGRGVLLSLRKEDEIGVDVALRGGQIGLSSDQIDAAAFAGRVNPANIDNVSEKFVDDPDDIIAGADIKVRELGPLQVGVHGVYLGITEALLPTIADDDRVIGAGGSIEVPDLLEIGSLYLEADWQRTTLAGEDEDGLAGYAVLELYLGDAGVVLEGLYLDKISMNGSTNTALGNRFSYNQPPTLERIDQEVLNSRNVLGGRARVDYGLMEGDLTVYANGMLRKTDPDTEAEVTQIHAYAGFDLYYDEGSSRLNASAGWRDEDRTPPDGEASDLKGMVHFEADLLHAMGGWAIQLSTLNEFRSLSSPTGDDEYTRGSTLVGVELSDLAWVKSIADKVALTFELGYDDQDQSGDARNMFYAGIVDWTVNKSLRIRALGGTQRGGLKCVGGVCRIFPEFAGGRLDIVSTFDL